MADERPDSAPEKDAPRHGKRVYVYFVLLVLLTAAVFAVKARWQSRAYVTQVMVDGTSVVTRDEVVRLMKLAPRTPMYETDLTVLQRNIMANTFVRTAVVKRDAPSTLRVTVVERTPAALLMAGDLYYIDPEGVVLPYVASSETYDIPVISGVDSSARIAVGTRIANPDVHEALRIVAAAKAAGDGIFHALSEVRLRRGKDIVLYSFDAGIPILFGRGDAARKLVTLDAFWQTFVVNGSTTDIQYIDVRYDGQVVVSRRPSRQESTL